MKPRYIVRRCLLLAACAFARVPVSAQFDVREHSVQTYAVEDGLSQSSVWSIIQDRQGFLWLGTADGLNRFDGYSFQVFRNNPQDPHSLKNNTIWSVVEGDSARLWIGTSAGLHAYDRRTGRFVRYADHDQYRKTHLSSRVLSMLRDHTGILWIASQSGLSALNTATGVLTDFSPSQIGPVPGPAMTYRVLCEDSAGNVWIGSGGSLICYDTRSQSFSTVEIPSRKKGQLITMYCARDGTWLIGTAGDGLLTRSPAGAWQTYTHSPDNPASIADDLVRCCCEDDEGRFWIGTYFSGVSILDRKTNMFTRFVPTPDGRSNARYEGAVEMFRDWSGLLWIGYDGSGVVCVNPHPNKFPHILLPPSNSKSTGDNFFKALMVDHTGAIWLGTYDQGIVVMDRRMGTIRRYPHDPRKPDGVRSNVILSLCESRGGNIWVGTLAGLDEFVPRTGRFVHYRTPGVPPGVVAGNVITSLCEDPAGRIWVGTVDRLFMYDSLAHELHPVFSALQGDTGTLPLRFLALQPASGGDMWTGTMGRGLLKIHHDGTLIRRYENIPSDTNSLSNNSVKSIAIDRAGILWIGTEQGLNRFDESKGLWQRYHAKDGLPNEFIYGVLIDEHGYVWVSTNKGLSKIDARDPVRPKFRNYTTDDGLQSYEFNTNTYFKTPRGEMFFGGVNGFNCFFPDSVNDNQTLPLVTLTGFKKFDQPAVLEEDIALAKEVQLSYGESVFSLEFAALEFTNPPENRYAYMMKGVDKEWVYCGKRREARYTNLDPGHYEFLVKASNSDGIWNEAATSIRVTIIPPFWRTWWFLGLVLVAGGAAFGGTVRFISTQKLKRKIEELEREKAIQVERLRTRERIARDLHDDLASTVGSAGFFIESVKNQLKDVPSKAKEFLDKTSSLLTEAEEAMSDIVWSVSPSHDTLESLLGRIRLTTADLCRANQIKYEVLLDQQGGHLTLAEDVRRSIYLIFKEALANAVRHSGASLIKVMFSVEGDCFELSIQDDGKGVPPADPQATTKRGHGLRNMAKRAEEIHAEFWIGQSMPCGTVVKMRGRMTQLSH